MKQATLKWTADVAGDCECCTQAMKRPGRAEMMSVVVSLAEDGRRLVSSEDVGSLSLSAICRNGFPPWWPLGGEYPDGFFLFRIQHNESEFQYLHYVRWPAARRH